MRDVNGVPVVWADVEGRGTWVRFQVLIGLLESRRIDVELPGRSRAMRAYFRERYGELILGAAVSPPGVVASVRAHLVPGLRLEAAEDARAVWRP